jgi:hypothetical protein
LSDERRGDAQANSPLVRFQGRVMALTLKPNAGLAVARSQLNYWKKGGFMPWKLASLGTLFAVTLLAGCSSTSSESAADPVATSDTGHSRCEAKAAEFAIGKPASPALLEQARTRAGAQNARFLSPNDMVTLEYRSDRLNLNTDASRVVTRVNCG